MALAAALAMLPCGAAQADAPATRANACGAGPATAQFGANTNRVGVIDLHFRNAAVGSTVTYYECIGERARLLGARPAAGEGVITSLWAATVWGCGRLTRHFAAILSAPDGAVVRGTSSARTMSCAHRFQLGVPRSVAPGRLARVRIVDRWGIGGIRTTLCVTSPVAGRTCRGVPFAAAATVATRRFRLRSRGRWRVELRVRGYRARDAIAVGVSAGARAAPPPTVLATGDSTMQGVETFLSDELGSAASVVSDVRPGFAMSRANGWIAVARSQAARLHPRTTVVSIGAAEGYPMQGTDGARHECCDAAWVAEYTRRVRTTMHAYRRRGRGRVLWLTIPAPRDPRGVVIFNAVNEAILRAAKPLAGVTVLRMDLLFTPDGYRDVMRYRGRDVQVREPDGIHLNVSGAAIAARVVAQELRKEGR